MRFMDETGQESRVSSMRQVTRKEIHRWDRSGDMRFIGQVRGQEIPKWDRSEVTRFKDGTVQG